MGREPARAAPPLVEGVADDHDVPPGYHRAADAAEQLLRLAREHRAADHLDPSDPLHGDSMARRGRALRVAYAPGAS